MRKIFYTMLIAAFALPISAQRMLDVSSGTFLTAMTSPTVERTVTPIENGYRVKYKFEKAALIPDDLFSGCERWQLDGFLANTTPEEPAYPYSSDSFSIPKGYTAQISIVNEEWTTVKSIPSPARQPLLLSDTIGYTVHNVLPVKSNLSSWFPVQSVKDNGTRVYKGVGIINVGITPVQFNVAEGNTRICSILEYEVKFTSGNPSLASRNADTGSSSYFDDSYLSMTTFNWDWEKSQQEFELESAPYSQSTKPIIDPIPLFPPHSSIEEPEYLIIAATPYQRAVEEFARWKRMLGFNVHVAYKSTWNKSTIESEISKYDNLDYLLFVGNNLQIPGAKISVSIKGVQKTIVSDLPYASPRIDQFMPDFSYGRIPVNSIAEASRVLKRIIEYEKNPLNSSSFYNSNLFISKFLGNDTAANMRNAQTTYEISKYMRESGREVKDMFNASYHQNPLYWNDFGRDGDGNIILPGLVPTEMRKPQYAWDATPAKIITEINNGYSQVFYFAHGSSTSWNDPMIKASDVYNLSNGNKLPVVFSMACDTGNYSVYGSFAEKFLTSPNGGAIGLFGFTDSTYIIYTDVIAFSLFNNLYPTPGVYPIISDSYDQSSLLIGPRHEEITELGLLHRMVVTDMLNMFPENTSTYGFKIYEAGMLTLFGDPSMNINLTKPKTEYPIFTETIQGQIKVKSPYTITLYNSRTNAVFNYKDVLTFILPSDAADWHLCVHAPGIVPVVYDLSMFNPINKTPAASEKHVVEEGKIWRYYAEFNNNMNPNQDVYVDVRLSGVTEIDGKEYLNCYVSKTEDKFSEESAALIAYMREENGRVYVRYVPYADAIAMEKGISIIPYAPMMTLIHHNWEDLCKSDILLFDINLEQGDVLRSSEDKTNCVEFTVVGIDDFECLGETFKRTLLRCGGGGYCFYEGVGETTGLLPFPGATPISYSEDAWLLKEVLDCSGNVIFSPSKIISGVDTMYDKTSIVKEIYRDLNGIEVATPRQSGVYLKTLLFDDGNTRTEKVIIR